MKKLLLLLPLWVAQVVWAHAQWDISEQKFDDFGILSLAANENGYYMMTKTERESQVDYVITTYDTPTLIYFDTALREQWRLTFRETRLPELTTVKVIDDKIFLTGSYYLPNKENCQFWVVCVDLYGQILWDRKYAYPNYHSVEGTQIYLAPDGNLILHGTAYRLGNSYGHPIIAKLKMDGTLVWQKLYGTQYILPGFNNGTFTADGMLTMVGHVYPDQTWFRSERAKGWVVKINCANNGELVWEKQYELAPHTQFLDVTQLPSGELGVVGTAGPSVSGSSNLTLVLKPSGEQVRKDIWKNQDFSSLSAIAFDPASDRYFVTGRTNSLPMETENIKTEMEVLDDQFRRVDEVIVDAHAAWDPQPCPDGGIITRGRHSLLIFR